MCREEESEEVLKETKGKFPERADFIEGMCLPIPILCLCGAVGKNFVYVVMSSSRD